MRISQTTTTAKSTSTGIRPIDRVRAYCGAELAGVEVAGPHVRAACRRHLRHHESGAERGLYWDYAPRERVSGFFRKCVD